MSIPSSRFGAERLLTGRCLHRRKVANNTYVERHPSAMGEGDTFALRLHSTDVVAWRPNGDIVIDTGGWLTPTTKARINDALPGGFRLGSDKGRWVLYVGGWDTSNKVYFADGLTIHEDGTVTGGETPTNAERENTANVKMRKDVGAFVKAITPEMIVSAWDNPGGDCFLCRFGETDCLSSHLEERYFHATLAYNAVKARGFRSPDTIMAMIYNAAKRGEVDTLLTDSLRKFLRKRLAVGFVAVK